MKIALCLAGYFDSLTDPTSRGMDGFNHINNNILKKGDVDVFIHNWQPDIKNQLIDLYKPKNFLIEKQIDFSYIVKERGLDKILNPRRTPFTILSHFYSVQKSFELCFLYKKKMNINYDVIIKSRFDLGRINRNSSGPHLANPFPVQCINFNTSLDMNNVYMANWNYIDTEGPADMWFYSNCKNMESFINVYNIIFEDFKFGSNYHNWAGESNGGMINSIKAWKWFFVKTGLWEKKKLLDTIWE